MVDRSGVVGGLVGASGGLLFDDAVTGTVEAEHAAAGGIEGVGTGAIRDRHSSATVTGSEAGGLGGRISGYVTTSSASGPVFASQNENSFAEAGGLVGFMNGSIHESYSSGRVSGGQMSKVGGLVGEAANSKIRNSYFTGEVTGDAGSFVGGFAGFDGTHFWWSYSTGRVPRGFGGGFSGSGAFFTHALWDRQTSAQDHGLPNGQDARNLRGVTSAKLKAALPNGFDPNIWGQSPAINHGYPYLLQNPPQ